MTRPTYVSLHSLTNLLFLFYLPPTFFLPQQISASAFIVLYLYMGPQILVNISLYFLPSPPLITLLKNLFFHEADGF